MKLASPWRYFFLNRVEAGIASKRRRKETGLFSLSWRWSTVVSFSASGWERVPRTSMPSLKRHVTPMRSWSSTKQKGCSVRGPLWGSIGHSGALVHLLASSLDAHVFQRVSRTSLTFAAPPLIAMPTWTWVSCSITLSVSPESSFSPPTSLTTSTRPSSGGSSSSSTSECLPTNWERDCGRFVKLYTSAVSLWLDPFLDLFPLSCAQLLIPEETPLGSGIDFQRLSNHEMSGGNIKSAIFRAASRAALR